MCACSTLQLLAKLLDFQKNYYANDYVSEIARIDPTKMRSYNFEKFISVENAETYRLYVLQIYEAYIEKRITLKSA